MIMSIVQFFIFRSTVIVLDIAVSHWS